MHAVLNIRKREIRSLLLKRVEKVHKSELPETVMNHEMSDISMQEMQIGTIHHTIRGLP